MSRPTGRRSTLESGTASHFAHPVMRSRPAHVSRDTTRRRLPRALPPPKNEARKRGPPSRAHLTKLTPYQLFGFGFLVVGCVNSVLRACWSRLPRRVGVPSPLTVEELPLFWSLSYLAFGWLLQLVL